MSIRSKPVAQSKLLTLHKTGFLSHKISVIKEHELKFKRINQYFEHCGLIHNGTYEAQGESSLNVEFTW